MVHVNRDKRTMSAAHQTTLAARTDHLTSACPNITSGPAPDTDPKSDCCTCMHKTARPE
jgi:hypothetical protein